jgi:hypothetical protein
MKIPGIPLWRFVPGVFLTIVGCAIFGYGLLYSNEFFLYFILSTILIALGILCFGFKPLGPASPQ